MVLRVSKILKDPCTSITDTFGTEALPVESVLYELRADRNAKLLVV